MFTIHGFFKSPPSERLLKCVTVFSVFGGRKSLDPKQYDGEIFDFSKNYKNFKENILLLNSFTQKGVIVPPAVKIAEFYGTFCDFLIVRFPILAPLTPYTPLPFFEKVLSDFLPLKHKTLIELSGECLDFDMYSSSFESLSYNQATLKCALMSSKVFFDEATYLSYFTYLKEETPHIVFLEDTLSLSKKHNLIKEKGFLGIAWKDTEIMADGNWESLKGAIANI